MSQLPRLAVADLGAAGRRLPGAFVCSLTVLPGHGAGAELPAGTEQEVVCREVLRWLPGRRLVARVELGGRAAVLKLFLGTAAARYRQREARGCELLARAGVSAPALLGEVRAAEDPRAGGLLFEYLAGARPLGEADLPGVVAAAAELGRLHRSGARHGDLHLDNFLVTAGRVFAVDGDGVRRAGGIGRRRSLDNLAVLGAQRSPLRDGELAALLDSYAAARGWATPTAAHLTALQRATRRQRRQRVRRYLRKTLRDCTEYHCARGLTRFFVCQRDWQAALTDFADDPESAFRGAEVLKAGNTATVVRTRLGGRTCIVKRYNRRTRWQALRWAFKPLPRYRRAWLNGQRLHFLGVPTARPLALLERRIGPLRGKGYLVMEDCGDSDLGREVAAAGLSGPRLEEVVRLFLALQAAELVHGDTKASNFLVGRRTLRLVDLDAMGEGRLGQQHDRRRFLANFDGNPEVRERIEAAFAAAGLASGDG